MPSDSSHQARHGYSKAQMCFFKILRLISSLPPSHHPIPQSSPTSGIAIDLNLRFCSHDAEFQCNSHGGSHSDRNGVEQTRQDAGKASVQVGAMSADGVHNEETKIEAEIKEEEEGDEREDQEGRWQNENSRLDLLIEAASVVSGKRESEIEKARTSDVNQSWMVVKMYRDDTEEKSPVVRTKRGRNQALPYRFRDSVMEPLKRMGRPHRPSPITAASRKRLIGA